MAGNRSQQKSSAGRVATSHTPPVRAKVSRTNCGPECALLLAKYASANTRQSSGAAARPPQKVNQKCRWARDCETGLATFYNYILAKEQTYQFFVLALHYKVLHRPA